MHHIITRVFLAIIIVVILGWLYKINYFEPYYLQYPDAKTYTVSDKSVYHFDHLSGPDTVTTIPSPVPTIYTEYGNGSNSRLAILLTNNTSDWLALARGLKSTGIPFLITRDFNRALQHKVVFVYPNLDDNLSDKELEQLADFPQKGGTLIAQNVTSQKMLPVFGIRRSAPAPKGSQRIFFNKTPAISQFIVEPEEQTLNIGSGGKLSLAQYSYSDLDEEPIAVYDDETAVISQKKYSDGYAYALGFDLGSLLALGYNNRNLDNKVISNAYVNFYNPIIDVPLQLIRHIYTQGFHHAVTLAPVPNGKSLAVVFTHDIDYNKAIVNSPSYAEVEKKHGIKATYFIQIKYIKDATDFPFFTKENLPIIANLINDGMEIASHSISHSLEFSSFPMGTGKEQYPSYQPYIMTIEGPKVHTAGGMIDKTKTYNGSILGEIRVGKFLLEHFFPQMRLVSFRPGYLVFPLSLPQVLEALDFLYTSSTTVGMALTHLPFQLDYNMDANQPVKSKVSVYQFPITIEDQITPLSGRLQQSLNVAKKVAHYGGSYVVLIHPDILGEKLEFEDQFLDRIKDLVPSWYGTMAQLGDWWYARDHIEVDVSEAGNKFSVLLNVPNPISGLTLLIPEHSKFIQGNDEKIRVEIDGQKLIIQSEITGKVTLEFESLSSN